MRWMSDFIVKIERFLGQRGEEIYLQVIILISFRRKSTNMEKEWS